MPDPTSTAGGDGERRRLLVKAAWDEYHEAHDGYTLVKQQLRDEGVSKRAVRTRGRLKGADARLTRAWLWLHELGEVELSERERRAT